MVGDGVGSRFDIYAFGFYVDFDTVYTQIAKLAKPIKNKMDVHVLHFDDTIAACVWLI